MVSGQTAVGPSGETPVNKDGLFVPRVGCSFENRWPPQVDSGLPLGGPVLLNGSTVPPTERSAFPRSAQAEQLEAKGTAAHPALGLRPRQQDGGNSPTLGFGTQEPTVTEVPLPRFRVDCRNADHQSTAEMQIKDVQNRNVLVQSGRQVTTNSSEIERETFLKEQEEFLKVFDQESDDSGDPGRKLERTENDGGDSQENPVERRNPYHSHEFVLAVGEEVSDSRFDHPFFHMPLIDSGAAKNCRTSSPDADLSCSCAMLRLSTSISLIVSVIGEEALLQLHTQQELPRLVLEWDGLIGLARKQRQHPPLELRNEII